MPDPQIGSCVLLHINNEVFPALVTNVFPDKELPAMVNVAFAAMDESEKEWYGRGIQNETSIFHESVATPGNMFWSHFSTCTCKEGVLVINPITGMSRIAEPYEGP